MPSISEVFAEWIAGLEFADIPAAVIADVRPRVLDNLGVQLASLGLPSTQAVLETVSAWGGEAQASVPGLERGLPAPSAATRSVLGSDAASRGVLPSSSGTG